VTAGRNRNSTTGTDLTGEGQKSHPAGSLSPRR
jgi:hypothetical protein